MIAVDSKIDLSIVIPLYNEQDNVWPLYERLTKVLRQLPLQYEILFVDDGSSDQTLQRLQEVHAQDESVCIIRFRKNFGQTAAMRSGFQYARGKRIITMDGDLQNDPHDIPNLLQELEKGYDLVIGWRRDRKDPAISRTIPSRVANRMIRWITGVAIHDSGCSLKAYRSDMIKRIPLYSEMHRFIPAMSRLAGARISEVVVTHHPRHRGESKYGLSRVGKVLLDVFAIKMLMAFGQRPMHWFCAMSIPFLLLSLGIGFGYAMILTFNPPTHPSVVIPIAIMLFSYLTVHFMFLGFLAELVVTTRLNRASVPTGHIQRIERTRS